MMGGGATVSGKRCDGYAPVRVQIYTNEHAERVVIEQGLAQMVDQAKERTKESAPEGKACQSTVILPTALLPDGSCLMIIHVWLQHDPHNERCQEWLVYHITGGVCNATRGLVLVIRDGLAKYHHTMSVKPGCVDTPLDVSMPDQLKPRGGGLPS
jgi:hypothetical protein